jgi:hypothetical protein
MFHIETIVALAPAIASAILGFIVEVVPLIRAFWRTLNASAEKVEWLREIASHTAFYGTVAGTILGLDHEVLIKTVVVALWFVFWMALAYHLTRRLQELRDEEERNTHRKRAGLVRSVVRSELASLAASSSKEGGVL